MTPAVRLDLDRGAIRLTFSRAADGNRIGEAFLGDLEEQLERAACVRDAHVVVLCADGDCFSSGMDLREVAADLAEARVLCERYFGALRRLAQLPKVVIAEVRGKVIAGGVGLVAASDLVFASGAASFALPELLWGLVPAMVLPFLARRMGRHQAMRLALTTAPIGAREALERGLVDEVNDPPDSSTGRALPRLERLEPAAIARLKAYRERLFAEEDDERVAELATGVSAALMVDAGVRRRVASFVASERLPWEKESSR